MKNTIAERIADFIKRFPPFDSLDEKTLLQISEGVHVIYIEKDKMIFKQGEASQDLFYLVHKGAVSLNVEDQEGLKTIDKCDEGDIFGLRPLIAGESYKMNAVADEESILYGIAIDSFRPIAEAHLSIGRFLIQSFATNTRNPYAEKSNKGSLLGNQSVNGEDLPEIFELQPVMYRKNIFTCSKDDTIKEAANGMRDFNVRSLMVVENELPVGILTDRDLRLKVATGDVPITAKISEIMTSPVITYPKNITIAQAQLAMLKHKIGHLCITKDGTPNSKVLGILSEHNIIVSKGNNPSALIRDLKRTEKTKDIKLIRSKVMVLLKGYMKQNIPMTHVSKIISELNDACIKRVIELSLAKMDTKPAVDFAWMSLGSQGRKEQLLHTDQDNAIVFEDVSQDKLAETKAYFLALATKVNKRLHKIGYEYCPAEMMANNPKWCLPLSEWKEQFSHWIEKADDKGILLSSIFFDFDISYGNFQLTSILGDHVFKEIENHPLFLTILAKSALRNPSPLGFFRQFLVETNGAHKDFFNIKSRALLPITDAGRVLILYNKIKHINNTAERFKKLATIEPENSATYLDCAYAANALQKFRTKQGLLHNDSGKFIELKTLSKEEKMKLKRCFKAIREVQNILYIRFNLSNVM